MHKSILTFMMFIILFSLTGCGGDGESNGNQEVTFKRVSDQTGIFEFDENGKDYLVLGKDSMSYKLKHEPTVNIERFESMIISDECFAEELCVDWRLDERGAKQYADIMRRNLGEQIFYVVDGVIVAAPNVNGIVKTGQGQFPIRKMDFDSLFVKK